jgi:hypothetical protein
VFHVALHASHAAFLVMILVEFAGKRSRPNFIAALQMQN